MERSEPSLVPEWLKGAGGGGGAAHHSQPSIHQDDGGGSFLSRQRSVSHGASAGASHGDFDSPRYAAASDRAFYPNARRGANSTSVGASDRPPFDRGDSYPRAYSSFGRSSGYRGYEGGSSSSSVDRDRERDRDRDGPRERDWDWEREFRDRERDRALGFGGGDDRDRDRDRPEASNFRRLGSGAIGRYESDGALRRSQSMGPRATENGEKKAPANADVAAPALPTAPPASVGSLTSSMQKAAFERNFPSLGAQEKQSAVQSGLGSVSSVLSPRTSWQGSSPRPDGVRPPSASGTALPLPGGSGSVVAGSVNMGGSGIGGEGWSSVLAEVPSAFTGGSTSTINGLSSVPNSATSGASAAIAGLAGPPLGVPKMSEALVQHPPRVRTPPQSLESLRMEETVLKQSRQLVPIKPSLPKNMGPRDKSKSKLLRAVDVVAPQPVKLNQPLASQLVSSPYRGPAPSRPELKAPQGKLLVRKSGKDTVAAVLSPSSSFKGDGAGTGGLTAATAAVNAAGAAVAGMGGGTNSSINASGTSALAPAPRKQKQLLDRRAVPIPPISVPMGSEAGSGPRSASALEDKRPSIPAQNRSDFFNALRKKSAGVGVSPNSLTKMEPASHQKNGMNENVVETREDAGPFTGDASQKNTNIYPVKENGMVASVTEAKSNLAVRDDDEGIINDVKEKALSNGVSTEGLEVSSDQSITAPNSPVASTNLATTTEEEEAFLRSLGWEESPEESGEGLTEEEINAFYQQRLRSVSISPALPTFRNHQMKDLKVGSIGSISSGMSSSDSESDDDMHIRKRA